MVREESEAPDGGDAGAERGPADVLVAAGASPLAGPLTLDQARRYVLADSHARFRRMCGDTVLFSFGLDSLRAPDPAGAEGGAGLDDPAKRRAELDALGLSVDWSRSFQSTDSASERWAQQAFRAFESRDEVERIEVATRWCASCRTVLPDDGRESCRRCEGALAPLPAGAWFLKLDLNGRTAGEPPEGPFSSALAAAAPSGLLGRVDGAELEVKTMVGTALTLFTPTPETLGEAHFIALSPSHPALEGLILDPELKKRVDDLRLGRSEKPSLPYPSVMDTGVWIPVPDLPDPLPLIASLAVDARFGVTAALGIPSTDPVDAKLAESLPPAPSLRWDARAKGSKPRPAARFRAHLLPLSSPDGRGVPIPTEGSDGALDPRTGAWTEALVAIPPEEREAAGLDHPGLRRWLPTMRTIESGDSAAAILCNLALLDALRETGAGEASPNGRVQAGGQVVGGFVVEPPSEASPELGDLAERRGADALRFALLHAAAPEKGFRGSEFEAVLETSARFLERLRAYAEAHPGGPGGGADLAAVDTADRLRRRLVMWCGTARRRIGENHERMDGHRATRNVEMMLDRIEDFERRAREERGEPSPEDTAAIGAALRLLVLLLSPVAPSACEELWQRAGGSGSVAEARWPEPAYPAASGGG
jgi:leucyl-tRNA synthetase